MTQDIAEPSGVRSVRRALDVLALLTSDRPEVSVQEIVDSTGLPRTTVIRLVGTLEREGLLWATSGGYMAGPGMWRWTHLTRGGWELPPEIEQMMRDLVARQGETVHLYAIRDIHRVCVAQQETSKSLRHVVHVGDRLPLWAGAVSKILLRDASDNLLVRVARSSPYGEGHVRRMREWIGEAAHHGYAVSHGELVEGLSAVAVPVVDRSGAVAAALSIGGPSVRFSGDSVERFAADLRDVARHMSERGFAHPLSSSI